MDLSMILNKDDAQPTNPSFTPFPRLPMELRQMIWEEALPGPRLVAITFEPYGRGYTSTAPIPAILHVNRESRAIGLKTYQLRFGAEDWLASRHQWDPTKWHIDQPEGLEASLKYIVQAKIFFNFDCDTAYFGVNREDYAIESFVGPYVGYFPTDCASGRIMLVNQSDHRRIQRLGINNSTMFTVRDTIRKFLRMMDDIKGVFLVNQRYVEEKPFGAKVPSDVYLGDEEAVPRQDSVHDMQMKECESFDKAVNMESLVVDLAAVIFGERLTFSLEEPPFLASTREFERAKSEAWPLVSYKYLLAR